MRGSVQVAQLDLGKEKARVSLETASEGERGQVGERKKRIEVMDGTRMGDSV